jgi:hypothetical protein
MIEDYERDPGREGLSMELSSSELSLAEESVSRLRNHVGAAEILCRDICISCHSH